MRVLVIAADGFIGKAVCRGFSDQALYRGIRGKANTPKTVQVDLTMPKTIENALHSVKPDVVVSCAGIVENSEKARLNVVFTDNLLRAAKAVGLDYRRIIVCGSAAEYGIVVKQPVAENAPINAISSYGQSKADEIKLACELGHSLGLPVVAARIFNPIGPGMNARMLVPSLIRQIDDFKLGKTDVIEVSRLDAERDYVDVADIGGAIRAIASGNPSYEVYNIGSGRPTSNRDLVEAIVRQSKLVAVPPIRETSDGPEPLYASQADISRMKEDLGWEPSHTLDDAIREILQDNG